MTSRPDLSDLSLLWTDAIRKTMGSNPPRTAVWTDPYECVDALAPFMGGSRNHLMVPGGGGQDIDVVRIASAEGDCIEFATSDRTSFIAKPKKLIFEHIARSPLDSFFLLELDRLQPSGVNEEETSFRAAEEVVELDGRYLPRTVWTENNLGYDEDYDEIPLPDHARLAIRYFRGKLIIVAKTSIWNQWQDTYDGRHSWMESSEIRDLLESILEHRGART